jgi:DNA-binding protein Fis
MAGRQQRTSGKKALAERVQTVRFLRQALGDLRLETKLREHVTLVVAMSGDNYSLAAELLGLHRRTLQRILRRIARGDAAAGARYRKPARKRPPKRS